MTKSKIVAFVAALAMFGASTVSAAYMFNMNLGFGMRNDGVRELQLRLNQEVGTTLPGTTYFGSLTRSAVQSYQTMKGITPVSGYVGPLTRAALNGSTPSTPSTGPLCPNGMTLASNCTVAPSTTPSTGPLCPNGMTLASNCTTAPGTTTQTGPVVAMLAATTPGSTVLVSGQATADLAHISLNGNGTVTSMTFQRTGISTSSTLTSVYLYDGVTRVSDSATVNTNGVISFNGLNIMVSGSKTISVKADIQSGSTPSGQTVGVTLTGMTSNGTASAANVAGNLMTISNGTSILAAVNMTGTTTPSSAVSINAGVTGYTLWSNTVQVNTRAVWLKGAQFRFIGSAPTDSLQNINMYVDGVSVATSTGVNASGYLAFDLSSAPKSLGTGSHTIDIRADIIKGSARSFNLSLQNAGDFMVTDSQLNVNVALCTTTCSTTPTFSTSSASTITVNPGSVTVSIDPTFTSMSNVTGGATNTVIGKFKMKAYGEDVKVNTLSVTPNVASGVASGSSDLNSLNNVTLYFNGSQVGSSANWTSGAMTFTLGSSLIIPAGMDSILEVRADVVTSDSVNFTGGTVTVALNAGTNNGQGMASLDSTIDVPPTTVTTSGLTIATGTLAVSANSGFTAQTVNPNSVNQKIGSFTLQNQSSSEGVRITNLKVDLDMTTIASTNISNLRTSETSGSGSTPINPATGDATTDSVNNFSVDFTLAPGATKTIDVFADLGAATSGDVTVGLTPTALGANSNVNVTPSEATGQVITISSGTFANAGVIVSSTSAPQYVPAGGTGATDATVVRYNLKSVNGSATISELKFRVTTSTGVSVSSVRIGSVSAPVVSGVAYLTGLSLTVPSGGAGLNVDAYLSYGAVGTNGNTSGAESFAEMTYIKYVIGGTTSTTVGGQTTITDNTVLAVAASGTIAAVGSTASLTFDTTAKMQPGMMIVIDHGTTDSVGVVQSITSSTVAVVQTVFLGTAAIAGTENTYFFSVPQSTVYASTANNCSMTLAVAGTTVAVGSTSGTDCMSIVGSRPTLGVIDSSTQLANSLVKVGSVTVTADSHGDIAINALPITLSSIGATACTTCTVVVKNAGDNSTLTTTNTTLTYAGGASDETVITFTGGYAIAAGQTVTLDIYTTPISTDADDSLTMSLTTPASFLWTDSAGNGSAGAETGALLTTYPTTTSTIQNY
jgi:hypothetical protein